MGDVWLIFPLAKIWRSNFIMQNGPELNIVCEVVSSYELKMFRKRTKWNQQQTNKQTEHGPTTLSIWYIDVTISIIKYILKVYTNTLGIRGKTLIKWTNDFFFLLRFYLWKLNDFSLQFDCCRSNNFRFVIFHLFYVFFFLWVLSCLKYKFVSFHLIECSNAQRFIRFFFFFISFLSSLSSIVVFPIQFIHCE